VFSASFAVGVGHKPDPISDVRGTEGASRYAVPLCVVPERGQVPENVAKPPSKEPWDVLHEHVAGSKKANETGVFGPHPSLVCLGELEAGGTDGLAGEASAENIDCWGLESSDIPVARDVGPVGTKDGTAVIVDLALPRDPEPGSFKAKIPTANTREERADT
jgi:hypothetical protein